MPGNVEFDDVDASGGGNLPDNALAGTISGDVGNECGPGAELAVQLDSTRVKPGTGPSVE